MKSTPLEKVTSNLFVKVFITALGLIAGAITIFAFFQEKSVQLQYVITANTNVLDINAEVSKLDILYDSTSLNKSNENLRIITLKVVNNGSQNILKTHYDENAPIGLEVKGGTIIEKPELIKASNNYLKNNLKIIYDLPEKVTFSEVILESGESFTVKLLVLHNNLDSPHLTSLGKIAGQQNINVVDATESVIENKSFLAKTFSGNIWVQIVRLISYFIAIVITLVILAITTEKISNYKTDKKRNKLIKGFKNLEDYNYNRMDDAIFDRYKKGGTYPLSRMSYFTEDEQMLNTRYQEVLAELKDKDQESAPKMIGGRIIHKPNVDHEDWSSIDKMIKDGVLIKNGDHLSINQPMKNTLEEFLDYLANEGEFKNRNNPRKEFEEAQEVEVNL